MVAILRGRIDWGLQILDNGGRDYGITWLLRTTHPDDGPSTVHLCPDLPQIGDYWDFGNESDPWAFCRPDWTIDCIDKGEPGEYWTVSQTFSTRPLRRCQDFQFDNPLLEPYEIGGNFAKYTKEIVTDKDGLFRVMSNQERVRGPLMEFDHSNLLVTISFNDSILGAETFADFQDKVNDAELWGFAPRCVKLSNTTWKRNVMGACTYYWNKTHEFEIKADSFDRPYADAGSRVLLGWCPGTLHRDGAGNPILLDPDAADPSYGDLPAFMNPRNYELYRDLNGDIIEEVPLDGKGRPIDFDRPQGGGVIQYYQERNLLLLGIPAVLEAP